MRKFYPLSFAQKVIWEIEDYIPDICINNITGTLRFKEELDYKLLEKAINILEKKTLH